MPSENEEPKVVNAQVLHDFAREVFRSLAHTVGNVTHLFDVKLGGIEDEICRSGTGNELDLAYFLPQIASVKAYAASLREAVKGHAAIFDLSNELQTYCISYLTAMAAAVH